MVKKKSTQNLTIYLGTDETRTRRIAALDRLARTHVPAMVIKRDGSERSVLFQLLADNEEAAAQGIELFMNLIGLGTDDPPPAIVLWNGRHWTIQAAPLELTSGD